MVSDAELTEMWAKQEYRRQREVFDRLWASVELRWKHNATHKRGFQLRDKPPLNPLLHAIEEASEVARADVCGESVERIEEEMGDTFVGLLIYVKARGLDIGRIFKSAREKLKRDIVLPADVKEA